jgi:glutamyl/glutaminyl-tRNA synthetase
LGYAAPVFAHLSLVMGPDHAPLSKRHGATSVDEFRRKGYLPEALVNYLALIGWSPGHNEELLPADELARRFRLENVAHSAGVFDEDKLAWVNRHYLKQCAANRLAALAEPWLRERGFVTGDVSPEARAWLEWILPNVAGSVDRLPQLADRIETVFKWRAPAIPDAEETIVAPVLAEVLLDAPRLLDREAFRAAANRVKERTGLKGKALFHPIRTILTGAQEGPELDVIIPAIDRAVDVPGLANVISCKERAAAVTNLL